MDKRQALFELSKGKFTTDPSRHSGEGVFFTSRMFDDFEIDGKIALVIASNILITLAIFRHIVYLVDSCS